MESDKNIVLFQFYISTIKGLNLLAAKDLPISFQFYISTIKGSRAAYLLMSEIISILH